ncbi:hypothetical protein CRE_01298 [Caenorhabditis remanei]|uniref:Uncharacterized protein n=1 Tax=Caenorhabditis remanei TaxID=31234 RepID=E3N9K1_CAERE|nr:hypothetical protein CRE_01298 [Caenorhabditis remanei]
MSTSNMHTAENCFALNCYQCLTKKFWKMQDDTRVLLMNRENEKLRLEAQLRTEKSEIRKLKYRVNDAKATIGDKEAKIEELKSKLDVASQKERELQEQHATEMSGKDSMIQELEGKLVASKELQEQQNLKVLELSGVQKKSCEKIQELQEQHATEMSGKDSVIRELESKLVASQEKSARKINQIQEKYVKHIRGKDLKMRTLEHELSAVQKKSSEKIQELESTLSDKNLTIQDLKIQLSAAPHQCANKLMKLQVHHNKELSDKDQVIQKLETHLATVQEQHDLVIQELEGKLVDSQEESVRKIQELQNQHSKQIHGKDLEIQQLAMKLVGSLEENVENIKEVSRQQLRIQELEQQANEDALRIQKLQEESLETDRRLQGMVEMLKREADLAELAELEDGHD